MYQLFQKYFIPSFANNYHPHILHTKRAIFYGIFFTGLKVAMFGFVLLLPAEVFVLPDVLAEEQKQIIILTNKIREKNHKPILNVSPKLDISSQRKAEDMARNKYFSHNKNKKNVANWLAEANYDYEVAGENLAVGFKTAEEIVSAWENSQTHYSNIIDGDYKETGVGLAGGVFNGEPTVYIVQHFAAPVIESVVTDNQVYSITSNYRDINDKQNDSILTNRSSVRKSVLAEKIIAIRQAVPIVMSTAGTTPVDKYIHARSVLTPVTRIFDVSRAVFLGAMIFFIIALFLKISVEFKKQHPHVIAQTALLISLLFVLWKY